MPSPALTLALVLVGHRQWIAPTPNFRVWFPPSASPQPLKSGKSDSLLSTGFPVHSQPQPSLWLCPALISALSELLKCQCSPSPPHGPVLLLMACPALGSRGCAPSVCQAMLLVSCCISWLLMAAQLRSYGIHILPA